MQNTEDFFFPFQRIILLAAAALISLSAAADEVVVIVVLIFRHVVPKVSSCLPTYDGFPRSGATSSRAFAVRVQVNLLQENKTQAENITTSSVQCSKNTDVKESNRAM